MIRNPEDFADHCHYILGNPVRAGLVEDPPDYPLTGSAICSLEELIGGL